MSTIRSSPAFACIRPNRAHKLLQRLAALLALDEARRRPPPVSLPGRPADTDPGLAQPHRQQSSACNANHILSATVAFTAVNQNRRTAKAPYSHDQLLQMNARFVQRQPACQPEPSRARG